MDLPLVSETLSTLRSHEYRGDYRAAVGFAESLPPDLLTHPRVALQVARLRMRQGYMNHAKAALQATHLVAATPGQKLLLALELAYLNFFQDLAITKALDESRTALTTYESLVSPGEWAEGLPMTSMPC